MAKISILAGTGYAGAYIAAEAVARGHAVTSYSRSLPDLRATPASLDWFLVSPAVTFSSRHPGEKRGTYRVGGDVLITDADGRSYISGQDFAVAMVDEIESHAHLRVRFTVAY